MTVNSQTNYSNRLADIGIDVPKVDARLPLQQAAPPRDAAGKPPTLRMFQFL